MLNYSNCTKDALVPVNETLVFYLNWLEISKTVLAADVTQLFSQHRFALCSIQEWFLSGLSSQDRLNAKEKIMIRTRQAERLSPMGQLTIDLNFTEGIDEVQQEMLFVI